VADDNARFSITLPDANSHNKSSKTWGAWLPWYIEEVNCYAVMIEGSESAMRDNVCKGPTGTTVASPGMVFGGYAPGTTIELSVTPGDRTIYIAGFQTATPAACIAFRTNKNITDYSSPIIVAKASRKLVTGDNSVTLTASLDGSSQIESCTGPDFPEPAATAVAEPIWGTDLGGVVYTSVVHDNKLYLGGAFDYIGPRNGHGTELNATTAARIPAFDDFKFAVWGDVHAAIPDGEGGWYIGGDFDAIGIGGRMKIARIRSDGSVHSWDTAQVPWGAVRALALHNNKLYVGGSFTDVRVPGETGTTRNRLFSYDLSTSPAQVTSWDPDLDNDVYGLEVDSDGNLYAVGMFTLVGGSGRNGAAKFDSSGNLTAWDPDLDNSALDVHVSKVHSGRVYLCGAFTQVGIPTRWLVAAVDSTSGAALAFDASIPFDGGYCETIAEDPNGNIYVGGTDLSMSSDPSMNSGPFKLSDSGAVDTSFNPMVDDDVTAMTFFNGKLYVGGIFFTIDSEDRYGLAAFLPDGTLTSWTSGLAGTPSVLAAQAGRIYVGAEALASIGGVARTNFGVIDLTTGRATDLDIVPDGPIYNLTKAGGKLLIGGYFTWLGDDFRSGFAMLDMATGALDANVGLTSIIGDLDPSATVFALAFDGTYVYVGSDSPDLDTDPDYGYLFRVAQADGTLDATWLTQPDGTVKSLLIESGNIYAAGDFTAWNGPTPTISGQVIKASKESLTQDPSFTSPAFNNYLHELYLNNGLLYVTGNFTMADASTSFFLSRMDATTGALDTAWLSDADGSVEGLTFVGTSLYISGDFTILGGPNMDGVGRIDLTNPSFAQDPAFNLQAPGLIWAFDTHVWNDRVIITGDGSLSAQSAGGGVQYSARGVIAATLEGIYFYDYWNW